MTAALIWCTFASAESARCCVEVLLDEGLASCANILPQVHSLYVWRGARGESAECAVMIKTAPELLDAAIGRLDDVHPYDSPAIIGWLADSANPSTIAWIGELSGEGARS